MYCFNYRFTVKIDVHCTVYSLKCKFMYLCNYLCTVKTVDSEHFLTFLNVRVHVSVCTVLTEDVLFRLLYNHAIEQCQSAALDELFDNPGECVQR